MRDASGRNPIASYQKAYRRVQMSLKKAKFADHAALKALSKDKVSRGFLERDWSVDPGNVSMFQGLPR